MSNINPAMPSVIQSYMPPQQTLAMKEDKMTDKTNVASTSAGNSTVSLSSGAPSRAVDYLNLSANQTVKSNASLENKAIERNETNQAELTYASNLQMRSNYFQQADKQTEELEPNR